MRLENLICLICKHFVPVSVKKYTTTQMENVGQFWDCIIFLIKDVPLLAQLIFSQIWEALRPLMNTENG